MFCFTDSGENVSTDGNHNINWSLQSEVLATAIDEIAWYIQTVSPIELKFES